MTEDRLARENPAAPTETAVKAAQARLDLNACVEEHGDYLFRYTLRHFNNHDIAEDLVQETFLAAVRSAHAFAGESSARTWLTAILRNKIFDRIRERTREKQVPLEGVGGEDLSKFFDEQEHWRADTGPRRWGVDPETALGDRQFARIMDDCLQKLPERSKSIFILREMDGLSRDEIAAAIGVTANNIGVMLHRARLLLRDCIQLHWLEGKPQK